jgi:hypothetical protein
VADALSAGSRNFAFRRALAVDPYLIQITPPGASLVVTTIDTNQLKTNGVTTFKITNEMPYFVWYRGWSSGSTPAIFEKGHYLAPGATDICTTQAPVAMAAVPADTVSFPIYDGGGNFLYAGKQNRLVMLYGSGN